MPGIFIKVPLQSSACVAYPTVAPIKVVLTIKHMFDTSFNRNGYIHSGGNTENDRRTCQLQGHSVVCGRLHCGYFQFM